MPLIIHAPDSIPMHRSIYIEIVVSLTFSITFSSIFFHGTPQKPIPNTTQMAVAISSDICEGPDKASPPKIVMVNARSNTSIINGMALIHTGGKGLFVFFIFIDLQVLTMHTNSSAFRFLQVISMHSSIYNPILETGALNSLFSLSSKRFCKVTAFLCK